MFILCLKSSHAMGMGHLFRMVNLYGALRQCGASATVVLLGEHRPSAEWLEKAGIPFEVIPSPALADINWEAELASRHGAKIWVNDRLQTDAHHSVRIKGLGLGLVTFDDIGSGAALADIHVAALSAVRGENPGGGVLTGLKYLILPSEIVHFRKLHTESARLVVSLGGSDTYGVTVKVAQLLSERKRHATLILGPGFIHDDALKKMTDGNFTVKRCVPSLVAEFATHDLAITGGGLTAFEAAAIGLPTVIVANEEWEVAHGLHLQSLGCAVYAGPYKSINLSCLEEPLDIAVMSAKALNAVDAHGANRVAHELMTLRAES